MIYLMCNLNIFDVFRRFCLCLAGYKTFKLLQNIILKKSHEKFTGYHFNDMATAETAAIYLARENSGQRLCVISFCAIRPADKIFRKVRELIVTYLIVLN